MTVLQDAIKIRRSRRKYIPELPEPAFLEKLQALAEEYNARGKLDIRLAVNNGGAFAGLRKSYGMFSGVRNYLGLIGNRNDPVYIEKLGYYGELLVLHATAFGLGACWVGGTFDRASCPFELAEGQSIICAITFGKTARELSAKEKLIYRLTHRKSKTVEQMYTSDGPVPEWFLRGMEAARLAPSAVNRQPVMFAYNDGTVTASVKDISSESVALDLGIAKLHFELGADGGAWAFGNGAAFAR